MSRGSIRSEYEAVVIDRPDLPAPRQVGPMTPAFDQADRATRVAALAGEIAAVERQVGRGPSAPTYVDADELSRKQSAEARAICLRLLAIAPRPRAGLVQALRRKEIPDDVIEAVLDRFAEIGLIDDAAYASSFVRTKHRDRALGQTALRAELRKLGVDEESVSAAVQSVDTDAERARATELIAKRLDAAMGAGPIAARRRLLGLLARRGYSPDVAVPVVERALQAYRLHPDD